jgi:hypothetical protein
MVRPAFALLICFVALKAMADSLVFPAVFREETIDFGKLTVTKTYDGRDQSTRPIWAVDVTMDGELIGRIADADFDDYAISPGGSIFVGISNGGNPNTAFLVIDDSGRLLQFKRHLLEMSQYCQFSMSARREWYDGESPDIQFTTVQSRGYEIVTEFNVAGCHGNRVSIKIRS